MTSYWGKIFWLPFWTEWVTLSFHICYVEKNIGHSQTSYDYNISLDLDLGMTGRLLYKEILALRVYHLQSGGEEYKATALVIIKRVLGIFTRHELRWLVGWKGRPKSGRIQAIIMPLIRIRVRYS